MPNGEAKDHKTLAIRLDNTTHAQLTLLAQLDGVPLIEEIRQAVTSHIERKQAESDFAARAQAALDDIDREAAARRDAIHALFSEAAESKPRSGQTAKGQSRP